MESAKNILLFQNMRASILFKGSAKEEHIAVNNLWKKDKNIFLNLYFHNSRQTKILDIAYIQNIYDLSNNVFYEKPADFVAAYEKEMKGAPKVTVQNFFNADAEDYYGLSPFAANTPKVEKNGKIQAFENHFKKLSDIKEDLTILMFISQCDSSFNDMKLKVIRDYIKNKKPESRALSKEHIVSYLNALQVSDDNFYATISEMASKSVEDNLYLLKILLKMCVSDGNLSYKERYYLAEFIEHLRFHKVEIEFDF